VVLGPWQQDRRHIALRELSDADRAYRDLIQLLMSLGGLEPSSCGQLRASLEPLQEAPPTPCQLSSQVLAPRHPTLSGR
jgi:hypothetical protein